MHCSGNFKRVAAVAVKAFNRSVVQHALSHCLLIAGVALFASASVADDGEFGAPLLFYGELSAPTGVTYDAARQRVLVADTLNHRVRHFALTTDTARPLWTEFAYVADRTAAAALAEPQALAVNAVGDVYVVDTFHNEVKLYRRSSDTYRLDTDFAAETRRRVDGIDIRLPRDIAVGADGRVYLLDSGNNRVLVADGPGARRWRVWRRNPAWRNPYGLDVAADGTVWLADTDNHRIIRVAADASTETSVGSYGSGSLQFRFPRDVAVAPDGRLFVADTHNHRIQILRSDASFYRQLGAGRVFDAIDKVVVTADNKVIAVDRNANRVVAFVGVLALRPFDAFIRDSERDDGSEPSPTIELSSPDFLFRYRPDIDLQIATREGLAAFSNDVPLFGRDNYVYLMLHNRGRFDVPDGDVKLYGLPAVPPYTFPMHWSSGDLFEVQADGRAGRANNSLAVPLIPAPRDFGAPARVVVGPLLWRPTASRTGTLCDTSMRLAARIVNISDPTQADDSSDLNILRINNNLAATSTPTLSPDCVPRADRYESNDRVAAAAAVIERWQHLHARCPPHLTRGSTGPAYPNRECPNVLENHPRPGTARASQEIWTLLIPNLSLHSPSDRDFFEVTLPNPSVGDGHDDIRSSEQRLRDPAAKVPMPECGAV